MPVKVRQNPRTAGRIIDGQAFVVTPHDNKLHTLNGTGTWIWQRAEAACTVDEIADGLAQRFEVDGARARSDAASFIDDLLVRGILVTA